MALNLDDLKIENNESENRYEAIFDGEAAFAEYDLEGDIIRFTHTEVPEAVSGKGLAGRIVRVALDDSRRRSLKVVPVCAYVADFIRKNKEYSDLVPEEQRQNL